jgi:AraC-like DNA-binding protein
VRQLSIREYGATHASHSHRYAQVLVGLDGELEIEVEGRGDRVRAGDGLLVAPGDTHAFESRAGSRCLVLDTDDDAWQHCEPKPACQEEVAALGRWLALAWQRRNAMPAAATNSLLQAWLPSVTATSRLRRAIDWAALSEWVAAHLHQDLGLADLAQRVHLSTSQFNDRCVEANGLPAMAWLRAQRLDRARALRAAGIGVAETARRSGYRSPSALTAALKRSSRDD